MEIDIVFGNFLNGILILRRFFDYKPKRLKK